MNRTTEALEAIGAFVSASEVRMSEAQSLLSSEIEQGFVSPSAISTTISAQEADKAAQKIRNVLDSTSGQSAEARYDAVQMIVQMNLRSRLSTGRSTSGIHDLYSSYSLGAWTRLASIVGII